MPTSRATARSVTASSDPDRSISASAPDTMSSVSLAPWPRALRWRRLSAWPAALCGEVFTVHHFTSVSSYVYAYRRK